MKTKQPKTERLTKLRQFVCYGSRIQCPHENCDDFLKIVNAQRPAAAQNGVRVRVICEEHGPLPDLIITHSKGKLHIEWEWL